MPIRIAIYGSCVSRDVFSLNRGRGFEVSFYVCRHSFASSFCGNGTEDVFSQNMGKPFFKKCANIDIEKKLPAMLANIDCDVFITDFIDTRFKLFKSESGGLFALPPDLEESIDQSVRPVRGRIIEMLSDEYFELWARGWKKFVSLYKKLGKLDNVLLNKVYYGADQKLGKLAPHSAMCNSMLDRLYAVAAEDIAPERIISYEPGIFVSNPGHRWGEMPFHYVDEYYELAFQRMLEKCGIPGR